MRLVCLLFGAQFALNFLYAVQVRAAALGGILVAASVTLALSALTFCALRMLAQPSISRLAPVGYALGAAAGMVGGLTLATRLGI